MRASAENREPWKARLRIPNYRVSEVARYARVSSQTIYNWHSNAGENPLLTQKESGQAALSYLQMIEIAVVAAFRKMGVPLRNIHEAKEYAQKQLRTDFPFADLKFKTDGKKLLMNYNQIDKKHGDGKLLELNNKSQGQLAWSDILDSKLREFEYDKKEGIVLRWQVGGENSPIVIDPRISFGAPAVKGTPTWVLKGRWEAGETVEEISEDFGLNEELVIQGLDFEHINAKAPRAWVN